MRQRTGVERWLGLVLGVGVLAACTQETQNKFGRAIQNWTGTHGVLEIYAGDKLVRRFIEVDKLSTAVSTQGSESRPYRFGYGVFDENLNMLRTPAKRRSISSSAITRPRMCSSSIRIVSAAAYALA